MVKGSLQELIWKMECKGYDKYSICIYISTIWMIIDYRVLRLSSMGYWGRFHYNDNLAQAHIEIDFMGYVKKPSYAMAV